MNIRAALGFAVGAAILTLLVVYAGLGPIGGAVTSLGVFGLCLIALAHLPVVVLLGLAWFVLARRFEGARPSKFVWARLVRDAVGELLPFSQLGGYAAAVRVLTLAEMDALPVTTSTLADLIVELFGKLPYAVLGLALFAWLQAPARFVLPALAGLGLGAMLTGFTFAFVMWRRGAPERLCSRIAQRWPILAYGSNDRVQTVFAVLLARDGRIATAFLLHLACWVLGGFEAWLLFGMMGIPIGASQAIVIDSLFSMLRTFAFFIPGAVGIQEAVYALLGALFGIAPATGIAFSLARRARDFAIGVPALIAWNLEEGRRAMSGCLSQP